MISIERQENKPKILSTSQLVEAVQVCPKTIRNWAHKGYLGHRRRPRAYWRFTEEDLEKARQRKGRKRREEERLTAQTKENLTKLQEGLKETELKVEKPLNLRKAAALLAEIGQESGVKPPGYPSHTTLGKLIKIAVILGDYPLRPEAIELTSAGQWRYSLTKTDLITVLDITHKILENRNLSVAKAFKQAKKALKEEREKRVPIENFIPLVFQQLGSPKGQKAKTREILIKKLQEGNLQEILILGVLPEDQDDFVLSWAEFLQEEELKIKESTLAYIFKNWPSLTGFLKEQLGEETKINNRFLSDAAAWLKAEGVSVKSVRRRQKENYFVFYHRLSPQAQEQLKSLLELPEKGEELKRILSQGLT